MSMMLTCFADVEDTNPLTTIGNIMKQLIAIMLFVLSLSAHGESILTIADGLTNAQRAELVLKAAKLSAANGTPDLVAPKVGDVKEWAELINVIGDGLVTIATKTGMAVNEFSNSKVGMVTMFIIAWNYLGDDFVGVVFGLMWLMFMVPAWMYCYRRMFLIETITYFDKESSGGKRKEVTYGNGRNIPDGTTVMYWVTLVLICVVGTLMVI